MVMTGSLTMHSLVLSRDADDDGHGPVFVVLCRLPYRAVVAFYSPLIQCECSETDIHPESTRHFCPQGQVVARHLFEDGHQGYRQANFALSKSMWYGATHSVTRVKQCMATWFLTYAITSLHRARIVRPIKHVEENHV